MKKNNFHAKVPKKEGKRLSIWEKQYEEHERTKTKRQETETLTGQETGSLRKGSLGNR